MLAILEQTFTGCVRALEPGDRFAVQFRNGDVEHFEVKSRSQNYVTGKAATRHRDAPTFIGERAGDCIRLLLPASTIKFAQGTKRL
jgi:hypothetical protein